MEPALPPGYAPGQGIDFDAANQAAAGFMAQPAPAPTPDALPGVGTYLPPLTTSSADLAAGLMARQPNAVVAVPPPPAAPAPMPAMETGFNAPPPALSPAPVAPVAPVRAKGAAARPRGPDELTRLDQELQQAGQTEQRQITEGGQKVAAAKDAEAAILDRAANQEVQFAQEQATKAKEVRQRQAEIDQQDAANLQKARDYVIPDFWKGAEGSRVGSIIAIAGGAIASGILGGPNGALQIINKQTDDYFHKQKEKVDNLYKYAEQTGRLNAQVKLRYAQELVDLKDQHSAVLHSIATRLQAAGLHTSSEEERKNYMSAAAKIGTQVAEQRMKTPQERAQIAQMRAAAAKDYAEAAKARTTAATDKEVKPISAEFDKDEARLRGNARSPGILQRQVDIRELGNGLREAFASGDQQAAAAAIVQAKEKISRLNTGAAPSHEQMKLLENLSGTPAQAQEKVARLLGDPRAAQQTKSAILSLVDQSDEHALKQLDQERSGMVRKYIANDVGIAKSPAARNHAMGRLGGLFGGTTTRTAQGEVPRYAEGGAAQAPSPAATTTVQMGDGTLAVFDASGKRIK